MKINQRVVDSLSLPDGKKEFIAWDDQLPGFGIRLQGRARRYVVRYRPAGQSKQTQVTISAVDAMSLKDARLCAGRYLAAAREGRDLAAELRTEAESKRRARQMAVDGQISTIIDRYLSDAKKRVRESTWRAAECSLRLHWQPFLDRTAESLTLREPMAHLERLAEDHGPSAAERARSTLSRALVWAVTRGYLDHNPLAGCRPIGRTVARDRFLSTDEIRSLWRATQGLAEDYHRLVRLALLTAQRRQEIGSMCWSEIDLDAGIWSLPPERTKNGRPHVVPLSDQAKALIEGVPRRPGRDLLFGLGPDGFKGWAKSKRRLDDAMDIEPWRLHDLRRTAVTGMAEIGIAPHFIEALVNHISGHRPGVAGIYNRATYSTEKASALQRWADHLDQIVTGQLAKVVSLHSRNA
jgi:integrase